MHRIILYSVITAVLAGCNSGGGGSSDNNRPSSANATSPGGSTLAAPLANNGRFVPLHTQRFDPAPAWPLCGRIGQDPPVGWEAHLGCPSDRWGSAEHTDLPLVSNFGPRLKATENYRYDFHRGIDIQTPPGSPVFAISEGLVLIAGYDPRYNDPLVQLKHQRPGKTSCDSGCYYSHYNHLSQAVVTAGEQVSKGQLIGYSGANEAGYAHLHFELRDVRPSPMGAWQRYAAHPLNMLSYDNCSASELKVKISRFDTSNPLRPQLTVKFSQPNRDPRLQIKKLQIELLAGPTDGHWQRIPQPGEVPDDAGYTLHPAWLDLDKWNHQYTHMDSSAAPWHSFNNCPFASEHGAAYTANVHLDQTHPVQSQQGYFNGIRLAPSPYGSSSPRYELAVSFEELQGVQDAAELCAIAHVTLFDGQMRQDSVGCDWRTASEICDAVCQAQLQAQQQQRCS